MKKRTIILLLAVLVLFGCKNTKKSDYKLQVIESDWSGWTENYTPEKLTNEFEFELGKEYTLKKTKMTFKVVEINKDNIVIETSEVLSDNEEGIDLNADKKKFTITTKETKLETPTMDAGDIYYFQLIK